MADTQSAIRYGANPQALKDLKSRIQHVFVLMLENRSFDHLFACSGIPGIQRATPENSNSAGGQTYAFGVGAPAQMSTDPGHEFSDVLYQLTQSAQPYDPKQPYPAINNGGFAANYASSVTEGPKPAPERVGDIMKGVDTPNQLPTLYTLATQFALCDHWFASLPGPTWPNRYFVHGASSSGLDDSPTKEELALWETIGAFRYANGSIFDALGPGRYRIYHDDTGSELGCVPQVTSIQNVHYLDTGSLEHFAEDLKDPNGYPAGYTFIEPSYGDISNNTYEGGTSQHPMGDLKSGDDLVRKVYQLIRQSPVWRQSMLIITYDEHGGFYDSVAPGPAVPPGDTPPDSVNQHGFDFSVYGVRVPAIVVSPWVGKGVVDPTPYDHATVLATLECLFDLPALTQRDAQAKDLLHLVLDQCRDDCPEF